MTNPGNALGTNGAYGGRTSVDAFNDVLAGYEGPGILKGWQVVPKDGLTIALGGNGISRDVALAQDDIGNKTTINNRSGQPVDLTLAPAPNLGQRIDVIVAYVNNPPEGTNTAIDNPGACGLIDVQGEVVANNPVAPTEDDIRTAIGLDGGSSTTSYYVVLATVEIGDGVTDLVADDITPGKRLGMGTVDAMLDPNSTNPVENKVVTGKFTEVDSSITNIETEINGVAEALTRLDTGEGVEDDTENDG